MVALEPPISPFGHDSPPCLRASFGLERRALLAIRAKRIVELASECFGKREQQLATRVVALLGPERLGTAFDKERLRLVLLLTSDEVVPLLEPVVEAEVRVKLAVNDLTCVL